MLLFSEPSTMGTKEKAASMEIDWENFEFPSGYKFCPTDDILIMDYLQPKLLSQSLPYNKFQDVNLNQYDPETLAGVI